MFEIICVILFVWLFLKVLKLFFQIAWGITKVIAVILFVLALPSLIGCLLFASGLVILIPVALIGIAFGLLKACI